MDIIESFGIHKDKFESLYMIIVYDLETTELIEKVSHQLKLINTLKDNIKRKYLNDRMFNFKTYLTNQKYNKEKEKINKIFFIHNETDELDLTKEWCQILIDFQVDKYIFKFGDHFDLDYLIELLTDRTFKNVIYVKNNTLQHIHINRTKKRIINTIESKTLNVELYIQENIKEPSVIHGSSVSLKNLKLDGHIIIHKSLRDDEVLDEFMNLENTMILKELDEVLGYMQHPKMMHRVVFGKDISKQIKEMGLKTIYCTDQIYKKMKEQIDSSLLNFEIKIFKIKNPGDCADIIKTSYNGAIGLTYY